MQLDSYLEIFTTMYGWAFANIIGEVITGTGLVIVPFMLIVLNVWREAKEQGAEHNGVMGVIDSIGTKLFVALFVFSVCFVTLPITSLHSVNLRFQPMPTLEDPNPVPVTRDGGTGSTYDTAMSDALDGTMSTAGGPLTQVPAWWFTSMAISSGINNAFKSALRNTPNEFRAIEELARMATINDPQLLHMVQRFYSECFRPAQSRYIETARTDITPGGQAILDPSNTQYGPSDTGWIGSQFFRTEPGFYRDMRSANPVPGFAINYARDTDYHNPASGAPLYPDYVNPDWGRPTCAEWWETPSGGLRESMISHTSTWRSLRTRFTNLFASRDYADDQVAQLAQSQANPQFVDATLALGTGNDSTSSGLARNVGTAASTLGVGILSLLTFVTITPLLNGLLMMQAFILMGLYMFLPMVVFLSGYSLRVMLYGAVGIFTVKFWAVLWSIVLWIDDRLMRAMYPDGSFQIGDLFGSLSNDYKVMLINLLMMSLFIGLPLLWTGMMTWIGIQLGGAMGSVLGSANQTATNATSRSIPSVSRGGRR